jgi:hypothetical protein
MPTPYVQILDLQERLTKLWSRIGRPSAAEFAEGQTKIRADCVTFAAQFGAFEQRLELPHATDAITPLPGDDPLTVTFSATRQPSSPRGPVKMSANRRHELLSLTPLGRAVLADEDAAAAEFTSAPTARGRVMSNARRTELLRLTKIGRQVLADERNNAQ